MTDTGTDATTTASSHLGPRLRILLLVVIIADVLDLLDSTITTIAAPTIARELGGGESLVKWLGASYALALGVLLVVGGRLGDRYGKRRLFLIGIAGFTLASLAAGVSIDPAMLVGARLVQGGFGALLIPQGIGILLTSLTRQQLPTVFSVFGPVLGGASVLGPIAAGFIINANLAGLTWRPMFLINIVLGGIGFVAAYRVLPADRDTSDVRIDGLGAGLLGLSMLGLIYGLIDGSTSGWTTIPILSLSAGAVAFVLFAIRQRTAANPLILPSLLANRGFTSGLLLGLVFFAAVNGFTFVVSLFFQLTLRLTAMQAAFGLLPLVVGIILASFVARPLIPKLGRTLVVIGLAITVLGAGGILLTVVLAGGGVNALNTVPALLVFGLGMGTCFSSIYDVAVGDVAPAEAGSASGSLSAVQQLAAAIGSAVVTTVYFGQASAHGGTRAVIVSVLVVASIAVLCLGLVWLLPRRAQPEEGEAF
ncbi:MFS transporter [Galbitalea sp. SE-J8]|uniref:MFS transporter n=1 Tax=Galbitalea sp. SE-J8 TaxID=3054952 RepID=UPI00259CDF23|nr:MFS transporter [Galbitalea sp. SE-J8]MDM4761987.1 MFS transporter [Galbitalea sp. SE-J8]